MDRVKMPDSNKYSPAEEDAKHTALKNKKELFEENPEDFIHIDDIVLGAINAGDNKYGIMFGKYPIFMMKQVVFDMMYKSFSMLQEMEYAYKLKMEKEKIVVPPGTRSGNGNGKLVL